MSAGRYIGWRSPGVTVADTNPGSVGPAGLDALVGSPVAVDDLTPPWSRTTTSELLTLANGERMVVQRAQPTVAGRATIGRRIRLGRTLRERAPMLGVPGVMGGDAHAEPPWVVTRYVEGRTGNLLLTSAREAAELGRLAGALAAEIAAVPPNGLRLSRRWADPDTLARSASRWLAEARPVLDDDVARDAGRVVGRIPALVAQGPPVLAHGDLAPVNLIVSGGRIAGLLDLERVRVAPPLFDAAWFRLMIRHHHPEHWPDAGPAFLDARGVADDAATSTILDDLAVLACLEQLASLPRRSPARRAWAGRVAQILAR